MKFDNKKRSPSLFSLPATDTGRKKEKERRRRKKKEEEKEEEGGGEGGEGGLHWHSLLSAM